MPAPVLRLPSLLLRPRALGWLYAFLTVLITAQHYFKGPGSYNNYLIFIKPFFNLLAAPAAQEGS